MRPTDVPGAVITHEALTLPELKRVGAHPEHRDPLRAAYRLLVARVWLVALGVPFGGAPLFPPLALGALISIPIAAALHAVAWVRLAAALNVPMKAAALRLTGQALFSEGETIPLDEVEEARADEDGITVVTVMGHPVRVAVGHPRATREAMADLITRMARKARKGGSNTRGMFSLSTMMSRVYRTESRFLEDDEP